MNARAPKPEIPLPVRLAQQRASNPASSAWVSANAGSGKTHVLVQRVLRLLLDGAPPSGILCLTFTKAAAANMATRVFKTLAKWTSLDDAELARAIVETGAPAPDAAGLGFARRLFARTIETPGGLKIQTIHAFCERLLHLFPFEANVAAGFRVAEEREAALLMDEARARAFAAAPLSPEREEAIARIARDVGAEGFDDLIKEALGRRSEIEALGEGAAYGAALRRKLGLGASETTASIKREMTRARPQWAGWAAELEQGSANDNGVAASLRRAAEASEPDERLAAYLEAFFTEKGEGAPRGGRQRKLVTNTLAKRLPDLPQRLSDEQERLIALRDRLRSAEALERSLALIDVAQAVLAEYAHLKGERGLLDFDDLIARTLHLLERADAAWVLYKLDAGVDHILVDEAQDTSAPQWAILTKLCDEFLSGAGAHSRRRTFFAVGDDKQSIFSFQGAAPKMFSSVRRELERRHREAELDFDWIRLALSFRSAPRVLEGVDRVFAAEAAWRGLTGDDEKPPPHDAFHADLPGTIELWAPIATAKSAEREDWRMPLDASASADPPVALARRIAEVIEGWLSPDSPERVRDAVTHESRRVAAGDVMILVRSRGAFFEAMIRALKERRVKTAGADRLTLRDSIAVMDLIAVGRSALLPDDDLTLAAALKSPLVGLDDCDLMALAPQRAGSLAQALAQSADERFALARSRVETWRRRAVNHTPYLFYARLVGEDGGRRALLGRLGPEAADAIDEFMALALAHEQKTAPSLHAFLAEIEATDFAIKRDMEDEGDSVRVMTVHAAKGLEAPIVFLPDTCSAPHARNEAKLLDLDDAEPGGPPLLVWATKRGDDSPPLASARQRAREGAAGEHRRLLYVAMTRAAQRLVVAGYEGVRGRPRDNWFDLVRSGLGDALTPAPAPWDGEATILRLGETGGGQAVAATPPAARSEEAPAWLRASAGREAAAAPLSPSRAGAPPRSGEAGRTRRQEGLLAHVLLQHLPDIPAERRRQAAARFLALRGGALPPERLEELAERALATLARPELAPLFAAGSRAEVAVAGALPRPGRSALAFAGRIDRVAVGAEGVFIADFKSGAPVGGAPPPAYVAQLALYRAALAPLYPDRPARAFLVWLGAAQVVEIPPAALDDALANLATDS
ncbi:MAG: double-strand break repair helicase AddA [Roseiarcus sp.]